MADTGRAIFNAMSVVSCSDAAQDDIGLLMDIDALPQRVRLQKSRAVAEEGGELPESSEPKGILL